MSSPPFPRVVPSAAERVRVEVVCVVLFMVAVVFIMWHLWCCAACSRGCGTHYSGSGHGCGGGYSVKINLAMVLVDVEVVVMMGFAVLCLL